ncbi:MAG: hypothetical protein S4CHLAM81_10190 [Chlamydiales bacterium]|nr:hypothetical protein [Chlamydiales bacterium]MCH9635797.1 hypothetical protein [Chlamydiales bacterium]MCH9704359.1 hypothetical protein [Chlamydiota bacterium]
MSLTEVAIRNFPKRPIIAAAATIPDAACATLSFATVIITLGRYEGAVKMMRREVRAVKFLPPLLFAAAVGPDMNLYVGEGSSFSSRLWQKYDETSRPRVMLLPLGLTLVASRTLDAIVGISAALFAGIKRGQEEELNQRAYTHLTGLFGLIADVSEISVRILNPDS